MNIVGEHKCSHIKSLQRFLLFLASCTVSSLLILLFIKIKLNFYARKRRLVSGQCAVNAAIFSF